MSKTLTEKQLFHIPHCGKPKVLELLTCMKKKEKKKIPS